MRRWIPLALFVCLAASPSMLQAQYSRLQGWCENGGVSVAIPGTQGSGNQKFQQSYPACTVTVFNAGTVTLSSIFAAQTGIAKANPFPSSSNGQWFFYASPGVHYDVQFSGGGIAIPFTISDWVAPLGTGASASVSLPVTFFSPNGMTSAIAWLTDGTVVWKTNSSSIDGPNTWNTAISLDPFGNFRLDNQYATYDSPLSPCASIPVPPLQGAAVNPAFAVTKCITGSDSSTPHMGGMASFALASQNNDMSGTRDMTAMGIGLTLSGTNQTHSGEVLDLTAVHNGGAGQITALSLVTDVKADNPQPNGGPTATLAYVAQNTDSTRAIGGAELADTAYFAYGELGWAAYMKGANKSGTTVVAFYGNKAKNDATIDGTGYFANRVLANLPCPAGSCYNGTDYPIGGAFVGKGLITSVSIPTGGVAVSMIALTGGNQYSALYTDASAVGAPKPLVLQDQSSTSTVFTANQLSVGSGFPNGNTSTIQLNPSSGGFSVISPSAQNAGTILPFAIETPGLSTYLSMNTSSKTPTIPANAFKAFMFEGIDGQLTPLVIDDYGADRASFIGRAALGTAVSPTALLNGSHIASFEGQGYGATGYSGTARAAITFVADEGWTDAHQGTVVQVTTTTAGTTTVGLKMSIMDGLVLGSSASSSQDPGIGGLYVTGTGYVGVGSEALASPAAFNVVGTIKFNSFTSSNTGQYVCYDSSTNLIEHNNTACAASSERYKNVIGPYRGNVLDLVNKMEPVRFKYKPQYASDDREQVGFIAERAQKLFPGLVPLDKNGRPDSFDYVNYGAVVLTKAIQELSQRVQALEKKK